MLAYVSFPDTWFAEANTFHEEVRPLDSVVLAVDEPVFAAKRIGAIAAKRMLIATKEDAEQPRGAP